MIRVGLIGFGLAGQAFHAPLIGVVPGVELACILDRGGAQASKKFPGVRVARSLDELLEDKDIRLCVIATPNSSHFEIALRCLLAGRDVVIDKPFATTVAEAAELIKVAEVQGCLLTAFQNRRWDGDFLTVKKLIAEGTLGRIVSYESNYDRYRPVRKPDSWRERNEPGSGILYDLGSHVLDQVFVLFGAPQAICADVFSERDGAVVDDAFFLRLEYSGMHAVLRSSMFACAPGPRIAVHGTEGSFVKYGVDAQEHALRDGLLPTGREWGENPESEWGTLYSPNGSAQKVKTEPGDYRRFYSNVRDAIVEGAPLAVTAREAQRTTRALELAMQSSHERRTVSWEE
jgi:predicted dehydrogenase